MEGGSGVAGAAGISGRDAAKTEERRQFCRSIHHNVQTATITELFIEEILNWNFLSTKNSLVCGEKY